LTATHLNMNVPVLMGGQASHSRMFSTLGGWLIYVQGDGRHRNPSRVIYGVGVTSMLSASAGALAASTASAS